METYENVDQYLANFSGEARKKLDTIRRIIKKAVPPEAVEKIGYGIPTFTLYGNLVHFAGYENHIGLYPGPGAIELFKDQLKSYKTSKGTIQFPVERPLPLNLIQDIVKVCVERNQAKQTRKK